MTAPSLAEQIEACEEMAPLLDGCYQDALLAAAATLRSLAEPSDGLVADLQDWIRWLSQGNGIGRDAANALLQRARDRIEAQNAALQFWKRQDARIAELEQQFAAAQARIPTDIELARKFHAEYERLAPSYSYVTRKDSRVPFDQVPENNKALMIAVCREIREWILDDTAQSQEPSK